MTDNSEDDDAEITRVRARVDALAASSADDADYAARSDGPEGPRRKRVRFADLMGGALNDLHSDVLPWSVKESDACDLHLERFVPPLIGGGGTSATASVPVQGTQWMLGASSCGPVCGCWVAAVDLW